jgi:hypothetical protein
MDSGNISYNHHVRMLNRKNKTAGASIAPLRFFVALALAATTSSAQTDPGPVNVNDRESVRSWFNTWWPQTIGEPMGFTGDVNTGVAGTTSQAYRNDILLRLNIYRRLAGVLPVVEDAKATTKAQAAAALNAANSPLSHNPPTSWRFYSTLGAEGSIGSLLGGGAGPDSIDSMIFDAGPQNAAVGHRQALLEPQQTAVGIGSAPASTLPGAYVTSVQAIYVNGLESLTPRFSEAFVLWPKGFLPGYLFPGRWSVTIGDDLLFGTLDLTHAAVAVTKDGQPLTVKYWRSTGGGSLIFTLDGTDDGGGALVSWNVPRSNGGAGYLGAPAHHADIKYRVTVSGIRVRANGMLWNGSGVYEYEVTAFNPANPVVIPGQEADLINISTRSFAGAGSSTQIAGFIVSGSAPRKVLVRGGGPWLSQFGVDNVLADPVVTLFEGQTPVASNDDWGSNATELSAAMTKAGASSYVTNSKDAALIATLKPGTAYTAHVTGKGSSTGNAIVEVYDIDEGSVARLINISTRSYVGTGASIQIGGFVLRGNGPRKVLIRAGGPWLSQFGVDNVLADPVLNIFKGQELIATNDDWSAFVTEVTAASAAAGVTPFPTGSKDAAIVLTLEPNVAYTAQVSGRNNSTGNALIEVYTLP